MQLSSPVPAVRVHALGVASRLRRLVFETHAPIQFVDITDQVAELVRVAGLREGVANVFSRHTTAAVCIQEAEPLLLESLDAMRQQRPRQSECYVVERLNELYDAWDAAEPGTGKGALDRDRRELNPRPGAIKQMSVARLTYKCRYAVLQWGCSRASPVVP